MNPKVAIVMPNYNKEKYIAEAIDSAESQTYDNLEIIVVEDRSTDSSPSIIAEKMRQPNSRIKLIDHKENRGLVYSRNEAIAFTDAEFIMNLDSDDMIANTAVTNLMAAMQPGYGVTYSPFYTSRNQLINPMEYSLPDLLKKDYIPVCNIYRKEAWASVGGYDANFSIGAEDWELWIAMGLNNWPAKKIYTVEFFYRMDTADSMLDRVRSKFGLICESLYNKYKVVYDQMGITQEKLYYYEFPRNQNDLPRSE